MDATYNEIEPFAVAWLRELIARGHIAPGAVDDRSIADLPASAVSGSRPFHAFAGIGGWSYALRLAGVPDDAPIWTGSCPCQPFSSAGKRGGTSDPRHLWPAWFALIEQHRPPIIFGEQVASEDGLHWLDLVYADLERCGYAVGTSDLCSAGVGAPHLRQRLHFVAYSREGGRALGRAPWLHERRPGASGQESDPGRVDRQRWDDATGRSEARGVADADPGGQRAGQRDPSSRHEQPELAGRGAARGMADHERDGSQGGLPAGAAARPTLGPSDPSAGPMGHAEKRGRTEGRIDCSHGRAPLEPDGSGAAGWMGNAGRHRVGQHPGELPGDEAEHEVRCSDGDHASFASGATRGFWADCDWIPCRDPQFGIVYRPVEPGTFPLAVGAPARVGRLRGYGNGINVYLTKEFIEAALEAISQTFA